MIKGLKGRTTKNAPDDDNEDDNDDDDDDDDDINKIIYDNSQDGLDGLDLIQEALGFGKDYEERQTCAR